MSTTEFKVTAGTQVLYVGTDGKQAAAAVARAATLDDKKLRSIGNKVMQFWLKQVRELQYDSDRYRDTNYRADYLQGIQPLKVENNKLQLSLTGDNALRVELGWAPPKGRRYADGIGKYDGEFHDLRPWLFSFGRIHTVKKGPRAGQQYRNVRFIAPSMDKQIERALNHLMGDGSSPVHKTAKRSAAQAAKAEKQARNEMRARLKKAYESGIRGTEGGYTTKAFSAQYHAVDQDPTEEPMHKLPPALPYHAVWMYQGAQPFASDAADPNSPETYVGPRQQDVVARMRKAQKWKLFRVIWRDPTIGINEGGDENFVTRGIKPAKLLIGRGAPVTKHLRDLVKKAIVLQGRV